MQSQRVLNRMGAKVLTQEEMKLVSAGSSIMVNTPTISFVGSHSPDFKPDFIHD